MKSRKITQHARTLALVLSVSTASALAQTTITGSAGGGDSWNEPTNWSAGVPSGAIDAIVGDGVFAQANNSTTPPYSGSLTLNADSTLKMHCSGAGCGAGSANAADGASAIFMNAGSEIQVNMNVDVGFPPITLLGDAKLSSLFGASDWQTDDFPAITGAHTLTLEHFNGHTVNLNGANGFSELICDTVDRWTLQANAAGALGNGDVTINPRADGRSASLIINVDDAMADNATLTLNGVPGQGGFTGDGSDYLVMLANDTIAALYVYGVQLPDGMYTNTEAWLTGTGTLTVDGPSPIGTNYCGPALPNSSGLSAVISAFGSDVAALNDVTLTADLLPPGQFGYFLAGQTQGFFNPPNSSGFICLQSVIGRYNQVQNIIQGPTGSIALDLTAIPVSPPQPVLAGETWNFQCWYRDLNPSLTSNFTDGLEILFQ